MINIMINLFFSYSHADEVLRNELDKHLSILKRQGDISAWHDRRINAGGEVHVEISNYLKNAQIILLLISSDFLASDYCYENELKFALSKHEKNEAVVIPVILRPCDWKQSPFGKLLALPEDGKPVIKYKSLDDAFLEIITGIKVVVDKLNLNKVISKPVIPMSSPSIISSISSRSSNLKISREFSDHEKDKFLDDAFEYISKFFEGSLEELKRRNSQIDYRFKKVDSQNFNASIYVDGASKSECMIFLGGSLFRSSKAINYSNKISNSFNSFNEIIGVENDGYKLFLKGSLMYQTRNNISNSLTFEGAAEHFWDMLISPLQKG